MGKIDRSTMYGIGASDVPTILGLNPFQTPLALFNRLTGVSDPVEQNEAMYWGHKHEVSIADRFAEDHNVKLMAYKKRYHSKRYPFFSCELDRIIVGTDTAVECKSVSAYKAEDWKGSKSEMPGYVIAQVIAQLGLSERSEEWVACLIGGNDYREKLVTFDSDFFRMIEEKVAIFWSLVENKMPPSAMSGDDDALLALYPKSNDQIQALQEFEVKIARRQELAVQIENMKEEKELIEVELKEAIGKNLGLKTEKYQVTWTPMTTKRLDTEAIKAAGIYDQYCNSVETRRLNVKLNKGEKNGKR